MPTYAFRAHYVSTSVSKQETVAQPTTPTCVQYNNVDINVPALSSVLADPVHVGTNPDPTCEDGRFWIR